MENRRKREGSYNLDCINYWRRKEESLKKLLEKITRSGDESADFLTVLQF